MSYVPYPKVSNPHAGCKGAVDYIKKPSCGMGYGDGMDIIIIHHNPDCATSRNVMQIIRDAGYDPMVVSYLDTGWTRPH